MAKTQPLIAVVDDDAEIGAAIVEFLLAADLTAQAFRSAEEFLASGHVARTACLFTDIVMPGMSGLELIQQLNKAGHRIPTIVITGYPSKPSSAAVSRAGVSAFLSKPVEMKELLKFLHSLGLGNVQR